MSYFDIFKFSLLLIALKKKLLNGQNITEKMINDIWKKLILNDIVSSRHTKKNSFYDEIYIHLMINNGFLVND